LICATGLSGEQMLAELSRRLENDVAREQTEVRQELGKIVELRLRKLVAS
jgi:2-oxo-4-hydroxy-4-carboxy-5-ureidoimidazoline decarboxylase